MDVVMNDDTQADSICNIQPTIEMLTPTELQGYMYTLEEQKSCQPTTDIVWSCKHDLELLISILDDMCCEPISKGISDLQIYTQESKPMECEENEAIAMQVREQQSCPVSDDTDFVMCWNSEYIFVQRYLINFQLFK